MKNLKLYYINNDYIDWLRKFDERVLYNKKQTRPYLGVVLKCSDCYYFSPLASPKEKHLKISSKALDIFKIDDGRLGVVNINNMIPTPMECVKEALPEISDNSYKILLENQITWVNNNKRYLFKKIDLFWEKYNLNLLSDNLKSRCCDFKLLEEKMRYYKKIGS